MGEVGPVLLSSPLKTSGTFYFLSGMCLLAFLHVLVLIPETKARMFLICFCINLNLLLLCFVQDHSLESIDDLFKKPWSERANIFYYLKYIKSLFKFPVILMCLSHPRVGVAVSVSLGLVCARGTWSK